MNDNENNQNAIEPAERTAGLSELKQELKSEILEELRQQEAGANSSTSSSRFRRFFSGYKLSIAVGIAALVLGFWGGIIFDHHPDRSAHPREEVRKMVQHPFLDANHGHRGGGRFR